MKTEYFVLDEDKAFKLLGRLGKMDRGLSAGEQKLAEKLIVLNDRGKGMLTRIYNIKKVGCTKLFIALECRRLFWSLIILDRKEILADFVKKMAEKCSEILMANIGHC